MRKNKKTAHGATVTACPMPVASAAPNSPMGMYCTNSQSRKILQTNPPLMASIAPTAAPKLRSSGIQPVANTCKAVHRMSTNEYVCAPSSTSPVAPNARRKGR